LAIVGGPGSKSVALAGTWFKSITFMHTPQLLSRNALFTSFAGKLDQLRDEFGARA
jgi:hypothetical protein